MSRRIVCSLIVAIVFAAALAAQQLKEAAVPPAPVPAQIASAKRVFISNAGEENLNTPIGQLLSGRSDRVYNQFYSAVQQWGRYELVSRPAEADLAFEIGFTINASGQLPEFGHVRLVIRDPKTNVLLWTFIEYAQVAIRKGNRDKNLNQAMGVILDELKDLTQSVAAAKP
jgi:hypothetical protein